MERDRKLLKPGDVYSLDTPKGIAYLQFVEWPAGHIPCFRVLQGVYKHPITNERIQKLAYKSHRFITSIPIVSAKKDSTWRRQGGFVLPVKYAKLPPFVNDSTDIFGSKYGWAIVRYTNDGRVETHVDKLSEEQKDYPEDGVSAMDLLADRIASGWRPRDWYEKKRWK